MTVSEVFYNSNVHFRSRIHLQTTDDTRLTFMKNHLPNENLTTVFH